MALPEFSMRQLLEAGVHFGHQTHRWNPKMAPYIFGARSNIHIMDLSQTVPLLHQALVQAREVASKGGRVLFVGTKRAASEPIANSAKRCAQYYVNHRKIPVIAILDTNCDPSAADFPIPGNDDAARAIQLYCDLIADAVLDGMTESAANMGVDLGAAENPVEMAMEAPEPAAAVAAPEPAKKAPVVETKPAKKVAAAPKADAAPAADAKDESEYLRVTREYDAAVDEAVVTKIEKHLGASLSNKDSKYVACSDETELETIVKGFMAKKLEITDEKPRDVLLLACQKRRQAKRILGRFATPLNSGCP